MMKPLMVAGAAAAMLMLTFGVSAQEVEYDQIEAKKLDAGKSTLSADKGYIFITGPNRANGIFLKSPDASDIADYEAEWNEELEEAKRKYPRRLSRWEQRKALNSRVGEKPVEPTEESFSIGDIERRMIVSFGPQFIYEKARDEAGEKVFSYLIEVEPGTYTYYGPLFYGPGVAAGVCYCMGTVKFEVSAGKVTSLGDFLHFQWVSDEAARQSSVVYDPEFKRNPQPVNFAVPDRLAEFGAEPADLRAAGKSNNFFGVMVGRMPPMDGVLAYDRDVPIDLKGLAEAETAALVEVLPVDAEANAEAATDETATEGRADAIEASAEAAAAEVDSIEVETVRDDVTE